MAGELYPVFEKRQQQHDVSGK
jgi:hypothetical protein